MPECSLPWRWKCGDERLLHEWAERWSDLVDFELVPVKTSAEAAAVVEGGSGSP